MEWIEALQKAITYVEEHLLEEINYEDVAKQVHTSSYEFHRAFSFVTGLTANTYIRNRRLSLAGKEIVETDTKITDLAMKYGYDTPESFTKAFTRFHGIAPKKARTDVCKLKLFNPLTITISVIALVREFSNGIINDEANHDVADFWGECNSKQMLSPIWMLREDGKRDLYGLCSPTVEGKDTFEYGIGIIIDEDTAEFDQEDLEKKGFRIWDVNPGTYVVFDCVGEDGDCIAKTWTMFYKEFLPQMGYEASEETDYELYFDGTRPDVFCELWIPIKKK